MIVSMTGFGTGTTNNENWGITAEARSFNSRFCEVQIRLPSFLAGSEQKFESLVREVISRGKVIVTVHITLSKNVKLWNLFLDEGLLETYGSLIERIESHLAPERTVISIDRLLSMPDIIVRMPDPFVQEIVLSDALDAVSKALKNLCIARKQEGKVIQRDIEKRIRTIKKNISKVEKLHSRSSSKRLARIREQTNKIISGLEIEPARLEQEIVLMSLKFDYTEEIVRLKGHIERFEKSIRGNKSCGSLLNFILQECHREINTIASKNDIIEVSELTVELKEEIERLREQIQNVE